MLLVEIYLASNKSSLTKVFESIFIVNLSPTEKAFVASNPSIPIDRTPFVSTKEKSTVSSAVKDGKAVSSSPYLWTLITEEEASTASFGSVIAETVYLPSATPSIKSIFPTSFDVKKSDVAEFTKAFVAINL